MKSNPTAIIIDGVVIAFTEHHDLTKPASIDQETWDDMQDDTSVLKTPNVIKLNWIEED